MTPTRFQPRSPSLGCLLALSILTACGGDGAGSGATTGTSPLDGSMTDASVPAEGGASEADSGGGDAGADATTGTLGDAAVDVDDASATQADGSSTDAGDGGDASDAGDAAEADAGEDAGTPPVTRRPRPDVGGQVTGTIEGGDGPFMLSGMDFASYGYVAQEFFLEGNATRYDAVGEHGRDGKWGITAAETAPYVTRLLVRRPVRESDFNGTVIVEWLNVTGGIDAEVALGMMSEEILRGGYGYVGVSVQKAGLDALVSDDSARYGALTHPGDEYGFDIFSQAGAAIGWPGEVDPMAGYPVERVLGYGQSQSAMRLITYVNAVQPIDDVYDGVYVHGRAGWGAPIGTDGNALLGDGEPVEVRDDLTRPILQLFTESEVMLPLGPYVQARQPDHDLLRTWEVAGAAHADAHLVGNDTGSGLGCGVINAGPQHIVAKAALRHFHLWLKDGTPPPHGDSLEMTQDLSAIVRDADGNALGGIRTPDVDAPIATHTGEFTGINPLCMLFGQTIPFTPARLLELYPRHADYVDAVIEAADRARSAGFVLPEEETTIVARAMDAQIPN